MKKLLTLAFALLVGFTSCTKESSEGGSTAENSAITFSIKTPKGPLVTYAIAKDSENQVVSIDIYAFDRSNGTLIGKLTNGTDFTSTATAGVTTVNMKRTWVSANYGKTVNFYFVANDPAGTASHLAGFAGTQTQFVEKTTNLLTTDVSGKAELIATPLLLSASADNVSLTGKASKTVSLRRRIARFDIVNPIPNELVINTIDVVDANIEAQIFDDATLAIPTTPTTANMQSIAGPLAADYDAVDFLAPAVFYLYPSLLERGKTEILINATFNGTPENYRVKSELEIKANTRYKIIIDPYSLEFTLVVADYDEGEELEVELVRDDALTISNFVASTPANWLSQSNAYLIDDNAGGTLTFDVTSKFGSDFSIVYVDGAAGDMTTPIEVSKTSVTTYAVQMVTDSYTVKVPVTGISTANIRLEIYAPQGDPDKKEVVRFIKGGFRVGNAVATDPGFIEWLKANVGDNITPEIAAGVTKINLRINNNNNNIRSIEGIDGFPNLEEFYSDKNYIEFADLSRNTKLKVIIFSTMPSLKAVKISPVALVTNLSFGACYQLERVNLHELDFSEMLVLGMMNLPKLMSPLNDINTRFEKIESIGIGGVKSIQSIDISKLKHLSMAVLSFDYSRITWGENPNLQEMMFSRSGKCMLNEAEIYMTEEIKTKIDFSLVPSITILYIEDANLETLDLSCLPNLVDIEITRTQSLCKLNLSTNSNNIKRFGYIGNGETEITVQSDFPVNDPESIFVDRYSVWDSEIKWIPVS